MITDYHLCLQLLGCINWGIQSLSPWAYDDLHILCCHRLTYILLNTYLVKSVVVLSSLSSLWARLWQMKKIMIVLTIELAKQLPNYTCCVTSKLSCWNDGTVHFLWCNKKRCHQESRRVRETFFSISPFVFV